MKKNIAALLLVVVMPLALSAQTPAKDRGKDKRSKVTAVVVESVPTPTEQALASYVYVGRLPCELGAFVSVTADENNLGYFDVEIKNQRFRMLPVATSTGAVRLEDRHTGAVWLQLANKSMLMNQKSGKRLADACMSPQQVAIADEMVRNPVPSVLDGVLSGLTK